MAQAVPSCVLPRLIVKRCGDHLYLVVAKAGQRGLREASLHSLTKVLSFPDMSQVIYALVPDTLKDATDLYSSERGVTLTSAVVDLLERGLAASSDERSIADLEAKLAKTKAAKAESDARLAGVMNELGGLRAFAQRANLEVGQCPQCRQSITGYELMALGQCHNCSRPLLDLLAPPASSPTLDQREIGILLGALAVALIGAAVFGTAGK